MNQTVSIFGATGAQGAPVVKEALAKGKKVRALARDVKKIRKLHPQAQAMALDLADVESITRALDGVEAAFVHLPMPGGPNDQMTWLDNILGAAQKVKLPLMVYSTSGPAGDKYPGALTGPELAHLLGIWLKRPVEADPIDPETFGQRVGDILHNPGIAFVLTDLYGALAAMEDDGLLVDTSFLEKTLGVTLTSVSDHIKAWPVDES